MNPTTLLSSGGIIGLFALAVSMVVWLLRIWIAQQRSSVTREELLMRQVEAARAETDRVSRDHRKCERRLNLLYAACNEHGVTIPQTAWEDA